MLHTTPHPPYQPYPRHYPYFEHSNATTHTLEALSASFNGGGYGGHGIHGINSSNNSHKRKSVVSLADLYVEDESAFPNTVVKGNQFSSDSDMNASIAAGAVAPHDGVAPLAKRRALSAPGSDLEARFPAAGATAVTINHQHYHNNTNPSATLFPGVTIGGNGKPIGPLSTSSSHLALFHATNAGANVGGATATTPNWIRQQDEVFSILEDITKPSPNASDENKPYKCAVAGCDKAYKNPNGLKYHNQHGHSSSSEAGGYGGDADNPENRPYVCNFLECGKRYKNLNGLKYHIEHSHPNLMAALKAHQVGVTMDHPLLKCGGFSGDRQTAEVMEITMRAALAAVESSSVMALAANAILTAHATAAAAAAAATAAATTSTTTTTTTTTTALVQPMSGVQMASDADSGFGSDKEMAPTVVPMAIAPALVAKEPAGQVPHPVVLAVNHASLASPEQMSL
ncbi:Transcriptional regulator of ribosomal biogenesis proteins [Mortierella claussenii]|nr:Transcriptional regulator of ribosomal biogenesis proteins [Mortierella claussenii]